MWSKPYHSFLPSFHHVGKPEAQHGKGEQQAEMDDVGNQEGENAAKDRRQRDVGHDGLDDEHVEAHRRRNLRDLKVRTTMSLMKRGTMRMKGLRFVAAFVVMSPRKNFSLM